MKIQRILLFFLLLPAISCEHAEGPELVPQGGDSLSFSLDTKALPSGGMRTFRVTLTTAADALNGMGTYGDTLIAPGVKGSWLAPCKVSALGEPLKKDNSIASKWSEADINGMYGVRFRTNNTDKFFYLSAIYPAIKIQKEGARYYYPLDTDKALFISEPRGLNAYGSWAENQYVYKPEQKLTLKERRARFSVHIECGELDNADIRAVTLNHITQARWYIYGGLSTDAGHYSKTSETLYEGGIIHLDKGGASVEDREWNSAQTYILPFDYSLETAGDMQPVLEILLGAGATPGRSVVRLSELVEPMKNYVLNLSVSKQFIYCKLTAEDWYNGGTIETVDEQWAKIEFGGNNQWDKLDSDINSDEPWNDQL